MTVMTLLEVCRRLSCTPLVVAEHIAAGRLTPLVLRGPVEVQYFSTQQLGGVMSHQAAMQRKSTRVAVMEAHRTEMLIQCRTAGHRAARLWLQATSGVDIPVQVIAPWEKSCLGPEAYGAEVRRRHALNALRGRHAKHATPSFTLRAAPLPSPTEGPRWPVRGMAEMSADELRRLQAKLQGWVREHA